MMTQQRLPRVTILYNEPTLPPDHPDADSEHDVLDTVDVVSKILLDAGLPFARLGVGTDPAAIIDGLRSQSPDVVFNVYEGTAGWGESESYVAGLLELLKIPFTGSSVQPILIAKSKSLTKQLLMTAGLPTAKFFMLDSLPVPECTIPWPVIVKPALQDASVGIDQNAVVTNQQALEARVAYVLRTYGPPVLIEQFIRGREFHITVWNRGHETITLPFTEIVFLEDDKEPIWPIVSFDAKWKPDSRDYKATPVKNPPDPIDPEIERKLSEVCIRSSELVGYRDYARVDVRLTPEGEPYILEVNPNPCINPLAGVAAALTTAQIPYEDFILGLIKTALRRGPQPELAEGWDRKSAAVTASGTTRTLPDPWRVRPASGHERSACLRWVDESLWTNAEPSSSDLGVVLTDGTAIGGVAFARLENAYHGVYAIDFIVVDPALRKRGCGRELLLEIEKQIVGAGGRFVTISFTSAPVTGDLRQFLFRCGYAICGEVPDYYRNQCSRLTFSKCLKVDSPGTSESENSTTAPPTVTTSAV